MKQIPLFKPIFNQAKVFREIGDCLDKGWTGIGYKTVEFEEAWKEYTNLPNAHFLNSATAGLHLALELVKLDRGALEGTVFSTPLTFVSTNHAILHAGLEPYFIDVDDFLCMDPVLLSSEFSKGNIPLAVIFVAVGGNIGNLKEVAHLCNSYHVPLIIDAAHAAGTYIDYQGTYKHIGCEADYTVFSFQAVKNLPTGDSGMLCCRSIEDDKIARKLSWLGISKDTWARTEEKGNWRYDVPYVGWKYHGNSIMAAIGLAQLNILDSSNLIRRQIAATYRAALSSNYRIIPIKYECITSQHLFQVRVPPFRRDKIIQVARDNGVQLGVHYEDNTNYRMYLDHYGSCPRSLAISKELISLPMGPHLSSEDVMRVIEVMNNAWHMA